MSYRIDERRCYECDQEDKTAKLEAENAALREALEFVIRGVPDTWEGVKKARAALEKTNEL